jgi:hypothetical protein
MNSAFAGNVIAPTAAATSISTPTIGNNSPSPRRPTGKTGPDCGPGGADSGGEEKPTTPNPS